MYEDDILLRSRHKKRMKDCTPETQQQTAHRCTPAPPPVTETQAADNNTTSKQESSEECLPHENNDINHAVNDIVNDPKYLVLCRSVTLRPSSSINLCLLYLWLVTKWSGRTCRREVSPSSQWQAGSCPRCARTSSTWYQEQENNVIYTYHSFYPWRYPSQVLWQYLRQSIKISRIFQNIRQENVTNSC